MSQADDGNLDRAELATPEEESALLADISALVLGESSFRELERVLDVFCPFEAMGMVRQEIRHSNFLAYILDPGRPHGFGSRMLERLLRTILTGVAGTDLTVLDIYLRDFSRTELRREWSNIDVLAISPMGERGLVTAVELKIESDEHGDQLSRMRNDVETAWPDWTRLFVFLTPDGRLPSDDHGDGWRTLDLGSLLDAFEQELAQDEGGHPDARRLLQAYIAMLRRIYVSNSKHEQIAAELWRRHPQALAYLAEQRPDLRTKVMDLLATDTELPARLSRIAGARVVVDSRTPNTLKFAVEDWDAIVGFKSSDWTTSRRFILFELNGSVQATGNVRFSVMLQLGRGDAEARSQLLKRLPPPPAREATGHWTRLVRTRRLLVPAQETPAMVAAKLERELTEFMTSEPVRQVFAALRSIMPQTAP